MIRLWLSFSRSQWRFHSSLQTERPHRSSTCCATEMTVVGENHWEENGPYTYKQCSTYNFTVRQFFPVEYDASSPSRKCRKVGEYGRRDDSGKRSPSRLYVVSSTHTPVPISYLTDRIVTPVLLVRVQGHPDLTKSCYLSLLGPDRVGVINRSRVG